MPLRCRCASQIDKWFKDSWRIWDIRHLWHSFIRWLRYICAHRDIELPWGWRNWPSHKSRGNVILVEYWQALWRGLWGGKLSCIIFQGVDCSLSLRWMLSRVTSRFVHFWERMVEGYSWCRNCSVSLKCKSKSTFIALMNLAITLQNSPFNIKLYDAVKVG